MDNTTKAQIIALIHREVIPAIGCTEPIAVALAAAKAAEVLGVCPERTEVLLSANILKNAMGVGIPGTGMVGLPIAIALGSIIGKSAYGLEVLRDMNPEGLVAAKAMVTSKNIHISLKEEVDKLYIEVHSYAGTDHACAIISHEHTHIIYVEKNGVVLTDLRQSSTTTHEESEDDALKLSFDVVYQFATEMPLDEIAFIRHTAEVNKSAAQASMKGHFGHAVSKTVSGAFGRKFMGDSPYTHMLILTAAACDARMDGAMIPVMSNSGSGNQGIAATLPVVSFAEDMHASEEQLTRALMLSHLMVIYIKQSLGRLSALCGCVVAATGASCGITYLMGGSCAQVSYAIKNMIGNITGMICDGAKPSCAMKVSSGVSTAMLSALMAMENKVVTSVEGIIDESVDKSILNLTSIGSVGMEGTDRLVLDIMTSKN
ncbi:MAG: L-serine ammonia-lyase, iron-sulfur-dependent, subunit alpha [Tannerellaceae bacterium]